jgi:hypothetical protein
MHTERAKKKLTLILDESGAAAVIVAIVFTVLCGALGLAFDLGHIVMVKGQLQRTADAAALAGVMGFLPYNNPGTLDQTPNWVQGQQKAHEIINNVANSVYNDKADDAQFSITDGTVLYGYWLLNPPPDYDQLSLPTARPTNSAYLPEPAIMVTLSRNVPVYLAQLVGVSSSKTVSARAIAILPEAYKTSGIPPITINSKSYYKPGTTEPNLAAKNIKIQSQKDIASWYNLDGTNDVPTTRINQPLIMRQSEIYLQPGAKATLTDFMSVGQTVVLPVVLDSYFDKSSAAPIETWCAFHITQLDANSMSGNFTDKYFDPNVIPTAGTGPSAPIAGTPKLVGP